MYRAVVVLIFFMLGFRGVAQQDTLIDLPPLENLIELAIENSPMAKYQRQQVKYSEFDLKSVKHNWLRYVSLVSNYTYGNYNNLETENNSIVFDEQGEFRYSAGIAFRMSLFDFLGLEHRQKKQRILHNQTELQKQEFEKELKGLVAEQYFNLQMQSNLFSSRNDVMQFMALQKEIAERDYKAGRINITDYTSVVESHAQAISEFETVKAELSTSYFIFEQLIGVPLSTVNK